MYPQQDKRESIYLYEDQRENMYHVSATGRCVCVPQNTNGQGAKGASPRRLVHLTDASTWFNTIETLLRVKIGRWAGNGARMDKKDACGEFFLMGKPRENQGYPGVMWTDGMAVIWKDETARVFRAVLERKQEDLYDCRHERRL
jgi:hypothetical protein